MLKGRASTEPKEQRQQLLLISVRFSSCEELCVTMAQRKKINNEFVNNQHNPACDAVWHNTVRLNFCLYFYTALGSYTESHHVYMTS